MDLELVPLPTAVFYPTLDELYIAITIHAQLAGEVVDVSSGESSRVWSK